MRNHETSEVKVADYSDISAIIAICEANLAENNREKFTQDDFSKRGFLMTKMTSEEAKNVIDDKENWLVLVAKENGEAAGYLTGCDITKMAEKFQNEVAQKVFAPKIFYHKQIAKKPGAKKIGEKLLLKMFDEAAKRGYKNVVCKIVQQPFFNQASISFHEKFGFKKIFETSETNYLAGVYLKIL